MRIAIATFRTQVSPRFDCANTIWLIEVDGETEISRAEISLTQVPPPARAGFLRSHGASVLLCGGLRRRDYFDLVEQGIEIIAGLMGDAQEILTAYRQGRLDPAPRWEPGRRFGHHQGRGQRSHGSHRGHGPRRGR